MEGIQDYCNFIFVFLVAGYTRYGTQFQFLFSHFPFRWVHGIISILALSFSHRKVQKIISVLFRSYPFRRRSIGNTLNFGFNITTMLCNFIFILLLCRRGRRINKFNRIQSFSTWSGLQRIISILSLSSCS